MNKIVPSASLFFSADFKVFGDGPPNQFGGSLSYLLKLQFFLNTPFNRYGASQPYRFGPSLPNNYFQFRKNCLSFFCFLLAFRVSNLQQYPFFINTLFSKIYHWTHYMIYFPVILSILTLEIKYLLMGFCAPFLGVDKWIKFDRREWTSKCQWP